MPQWLAGIFAAVVILLGLSFCDGSARHRDVSSVSPFAEFVGKTCEVKLAVRAHGVTAIGSPYKQTDFVTVWEPGFTGPEVTFVEELQPGTRMHVLSARKCWNCPFDDIFDFVVRVEPLPERFKGVEVYVRAETLMDNYMQCRR